MPTFDDATIEALLNGETLDARILIEFDFVSGPFRVCESTTDFTDNNGVLWRATHDILQMSEIEASGDFRDQDATYTATNIGTAEFQSAIDERSEWDGRTCTRFMQFFVNGAAYSTPLVLHKGRMTQVRYQLTVDNGPSVQVVVSSLFARKRGSSLGYYTNADQQARSPGDRFCEYTPQMRDYRWTFPNY